MEASLGALSRVRRPPPQQLFHRLLAQRCSLYSAHANTPNMRTTMRAAMPQTMAAAGMKQCGREGRWQRVARIDRRRRQGARPFGREPLCSTSQAHGAAVSNSRAHRGGRARPSRKRIERRVLQGLQRAPHTPAHRCGCRYVSEQAPCAAAPLSPGYPPGQRPERPHKPVNGCCTIGVPAQMHGAALDRG